ncbi:MAG: hypothetical protein PHW66_09630 [Gallionella sp.]|nr:hypothetical protein [Gallionella sp.]
MPTLQFLSSEADDAKWLIWGKILHAKGTRGNKFPDPNVLVKITDHSVLVKRFPQAFYYTGNVAAPCQCRRLAIIIQAPSIPTAVLTVENSVTSAVDGGIINTYDAVARVGGVEVGRVSGAATTLWGNASDPDGVVAVRTMTNRPGMSATAHSGPKPSVYALLSSEPTYARFGTWPGSFYYDVVAYNDYWTTPFDAAIEALLLSVQDGQRTLILLSDGTQLASIPYTDDGAGNKTNYPQITTWSGDGWIQLFNTSDNGAHWTAGDRVNFTVPTDACLSISSAPSLPTGAATSLPTWAADWAAAQAVATTRERARVKLCADNLKANLKAGALQDQIKSVMRSNHPISANTYQKALMTAVVVNGSSGSGDDITNTKTVTLSYQSTDGDGNPITLQEVVTGTQHVVTTRCANSSGAPNAVSYVTTTYTNWLPTSTTGDTGTALDYTYQLDNTHGLAQMWNGVVVTGAATIAATFDSLGGLYSPPYPQSSDSRTYSYPQLYIDYRAATARLYKVGSWNTNWLDSCFKNGETIDLFPLSVIHDDLGDLGMFPQAADITDTSKLALQADMKATFKYDYKTGGWTGSGANLKDTNQNDTTISIPYQAGANMVFRSRTTPWADVATDSPLTDASYKGQAAAIKATPGDYPLFVPLLTS